MKFVSILLTLALVQLVRGDEYRIVKDDEKAAESKAASGSKADIVRRFFEFVELSPELDEETLARYDQQMVDKMAELLEKKGDIAEVYTLNGKINALIYNLVQARVKVAEEPLKPADEALLQTIDLVVPNSEARPEIALAKAELRQFCLEQLDSCRELLEGLGASLWQEDLHTMKAIFMLESFYRSWVPLGRLSNYINNYGQSDKAD